MKTYLFFLLFVLFSAGFSSPSTASERETASERVVRTHIVRCGYSEAKPYMYKDIQTGEIKGAYPEILLEAAKLLGFKIEWTMEPGYAEFAEGLKTGHYDAFCAPVAIIPSRSLVSISTKPIVYIPNTLYVPKGKEKGHLISDYDRKTVKLGAVDGESFQILSRRLFPHAEEHSLPNMTPASSLLMDVATGKADGAIYDPVIIHEFNKNNAPKFEFVPAFKKPLVVNPQTLFTVLPEDTHLLNMFNVSLQTLLDNGRINEILNRNGLTADLAYRIQPPYKIGE